MKDMKRNIKVSEYREARKKQLKNLQDSYRRAKDPVLKKKRKAQITMLKRELGMK